MKRILLSGTVALMLVAAMALSGVAQAKPAGASANTRCLQEAETLTGLDLTGYNVVVGNNRRADDFTGKATAGADLFCGRGGDDRIDTLGEDDVFIGGAGNDSVVTNYGYFYGGAGNDSVGTNNGSGYFNGGDGEDSVGFNHGDFYGGADMDHVGTNHRYFYGGAGDDTVGVNYGSFYGEEGNDSVQIYDGGTFIQD